MYAIIESGGKQYRVTAGDILTLENIPGKTGDVVTFDKVLLVAGGKDNKVLVGKPYLASANLKAEIVDDSHLGEKIVTIKYKRRKQYRRTIGHRQELMRFLVTKIEDGQGGKLEFDSNKRKDVLIKASVKFSDRAEKRAAKALAAGKTAAKTTSAKTEKKPAAKKSAAK